MCVCGGGGGYDKVYVYITAMKVQISNLTVRDNAKGASACIGILGVVISITSPE